MFDAFYDLWQRASALPLGGIFFDFEMYHAQDQLGGYPNTVDFSDISWHLFANNMQLADAQNIKRTEERVRFLQKRKLLNAYGEFHRDTLRKIGRRIREHIYAKNPDVKIGVYAPALPAKKYALLT